MKPARAFMIATTAVLASVIALGAAEIGIRALYALHVVHDTGRNWDFYKNTYTGDGFKCSFQEALEPHPYFGWILAPFEPCRRFTRNNRGIWDRRDFPETRDPDFFTILITGGSVAGQFAHGNADGYNPRYWLEEELNDHYQSPNGRPFRVLSGALGGWRMPIQYIVAGQLGSKVDAVVSLDGYNEALSAQEGAPLDRPDAWTWYAMHDQQRGSRTLTALQMLRYFRLSASSLPLVRDSKATFFAFEGLIWMFQDMNNGLGVTDELKFQFSYPSGWSREQLITANAQKWQESLRVMRAVTSSLGLKYAHFIQPIPTLGKVLTGEEKLHPQWVTGDFYHKIIIDPAEELARRHGFPIRSLDQVFAHKIETVYHDEIHCGYDLDGDSVGYRMMAESMARSLGEMWRLKPKTPSVERLAHSQTRPTHPPMPSHY